MVNLASCLAKNRTGHCFICVSGSGAAAEAAVRLGPAVTGQLQISRSILVCQQGPSEGHWSEVDWLRAGSEKDLFTQCK